MSTRYLPRHTCLASLRTVLTVTAHSPPPHIQALNAHSPAPYIQASDRFHHGDPPHRRVGEDAAREGRQHRRQPCGGREVQHLASGADVRARRRADPGSFSARGRVLTARLPARDVIVKLPQLHARHDRDAHRLILSLAEHHLRKVREQKAWRESGTGRPKQNRLTDFARQLDVRGRDGRHGGQRRAGRLRLRRHAGGPVGAVGRESQGDQEGPLTKPRHHRVYCLFFPR